MNTSLLLRFTRRLEDSSFLDDLRQKLPFQRFFAARPGLHDFLQGHGAGHALHPAVVQLPLGTLAGTLIMDAAGEPSAADKLMLVSLAGFFPSAVTGWAEWVDADDRSQRVGLAHAVTNAVGVYLVAASCLSRHRNHRVNGVVLTCLAAMVWGLGGYLGGHISLARKYASHADGEVGGAGHGSYRA